jgi:hypothetical protein
MNIYIVTETSYYGETYCYEYKNINTKDLPDAVANACASAFEEYEKLAENADVPADALYTSIHVVEMSTTKPISSYYIYVDDCSI